MGEKIERVKKHVKEHQKLYIGVGIGVAVTTSIVILRNRTPSEVIALNYNAPKFNWRPENNQMVVNLVERSTPSKPVHLVGTNLFFSSLNEASRQTGHSLAQISRNVNGHIPDVHGDVFQLLDSAA